MPPVRRTRWRGTPLTCCASTWRTAWCVPPWSRHRELLGRARMAVPPLHHLFSAAHYALRRRRAVRLAGLARVAVRPAPPRGDTRHHVLLGHQPGAVHDRVVRRDRGDVRRVSRGTLVGAAVSATATKNGGDDAA